ncbi:MAG: hypothetical protein IPL12_06840 [Bacteroidetes bacterium]|nr:hypothetical protein [Bacteroidota bacterium]
MCKTLNYGKETIADKIERVMHEFRKVIKSGKGEALAGEEAAKKKK